MAYYVRLPVEPLYCPIVEFVDRPPPGYRTFDYLRSGERVCPEVVPKRVRVSSAHKRVPDIFSVRWYWGIRQKVKDLIEEREPGVHQFFLVELTYKDGRTEPDPLYVLNICRRMDAMLFDQSDLSWNDNGYPSIKLIPGVLVHDRAAIAAFHVWRGEKLGSTKIFMSEDLYDAIKREKLKKLLAYRTLEK